MSWLAWGRAQLGGMPWTLSWGRQVALARAVIMLAPGAFLVLAHLASGRLSLTWLLLAALGLGCARWPDSGVPLASSVVLGIVWFMAVAGFSWLAVPAALVGLAGHAATAFVAGAPPDAAVNRSLGLRWLWRLLIVSAGTVTVAVVAWTLSGWGIAGSRAVTAATLLGLAGWILVLGREKSPSGTEPTSGLHHTVGRRVKWRVARR